jgi:replicative DNA helicase
MSKTKLPPHNKEIEDVVLGALLLESNLIFLHINKLAIDFFYQTKNKLVFKAIQSLFDKMQGVDLMTVTNQLISTNELEIVGGAYEVVKLTNKVTSSVNIEDWIMVLHNSYLQRQGIQIGRQLTNDSYDSIEIENTLNAASANILASQENIYKQTEKNLNYFLLELAKERDAINETGQIGIDTGWQSLNQYISGWVKPDLVILAARPAQGKTAFMLNTILNVLKQGKSVGIFSLEMSGSQLVNRLLSLESGIAHSHLRHNTMTSAQRTDLMDAHERISKYKLYIDDSPSINIRDLRSKASILKRKYNIDFLCIDYLQLMSGVDRKANRESEISEISRGCKIIAKELSIPVMALSQLSRAVESRSDKMPQLSDLRESGAIEQDADSVIFLMRPETYGIQSIEVDGQDQNAKDVCVVKIAKNRHGSLKSIPFKFIGERMEFKEINYNQF